MEAGQGELPSLEEWGESMSTLISPRLHCSSNFTEPFTVSITVIGKAVDGISVCRSSLET